MKVYAHFDLDLDMKPCEGVVRMDEYVLEVFDKSIKMDTIKELSVAVGIGCGHMLATFKDGSEAILCRFTLSHLKTIGEFAKSCNYFVETGELMDIDHVTQVCEKCGRTLVEGVDSCLFCYNRVTVLKRAWSLMQPYKNEVIKAAAMLMLSSVLYLTVPLINRFLVDKFLEPKTGTAVMIIAMAAAMFMARAIGEVIFIINSRIFNRASIKYANSLRNLAYERVQSFSMSSLAKRTTGDMMRRILQDTITIKDFITDHGRWVCEMIIMFIVVLVLMLVTDWRMTLLVCVPIPVAAFFWTRFRHQMNIRYERQWRKQSKCNTILHDILKGIRVVKSFGNEKREIQKFSDAAKELAFVSSDNEKLWALLFPTIGFFASFGEFLTLYFGGRAILGGTFTLGELVQFTMYIGFIYGPLRWIISFPRWLAEALTSMVKLFEILDEKTDVREAENAKIVPISGGISFENVSFGYKSYEPVLKGISFDIKPGEMVGIVGRSGVGKSTLINLVMRLYDVNNGRICINGEDIRDISQNHLHENIGVVFQDVFLFAGTIYDNIAAAKHNATYEEVIGAAKLANAHDFIMKMPDGYNTVIGESGYTISGGERQRIAIARAVIKDPEILILDEATSSLDVETEQIIQDSLNKLVKGRTTLAIAHRLSTLRNADRLIVLEKGKLAEIGTHTELLKSKGIYYGFVMAQRNTSKLKGQSA